jgi:hypothetical protein
MLDAAGLRAALDQIQPLPYPERNVYRSVGLAALIGDGSHKIQPLYDLGPRESGQRYTPSEGPVYYMFPNIMPRLTLKQLACAPSPLLRM